MPLHEYKCKKCNYEFEELVSDNDDLVICKKCGSEVEIRMSVFSSVTEGGSVNESADMKIGREADRRWQMHQDRQSRRHKLVGKKPEPIKIPVVKGKSMPAMVVGTKEDKNKREEFSTALNEHRKKRIKRGQPQFLEAGPF